MKKVYIYLLASSIKDGGMARNFAFKNYIYPVDVNINVYCKNIFERVLLMIRMTFFFLFSKKKKVFIHQGTLIYIYPIILLKFGLIRFLFKRGIEIFINNNTVYFEVNDLPYEQSIDLGYEVKQENLFFEKFLYSQLKLNFIFASKEMRNYACEQYNIDIRNTQVILNGGYDLESNFETNKELLSSKIKYVYCGTLNKGRGIQEIIEIFKENTDLLLVLLGTEGEWISEDTEITENIIYLGSLEEQEAHKIVAQCDIGIINYDEDKLYYNICFPTKVSFYITAGIAVLSTPLKELVNDFGDVFIFSKIKDFEKTIQQISHEDVVKYKNKVISIKNNYSWKSLLSQLEF
ncbi:hypothetical protein [Chryseobacterium sp. c4a]|uniref:hypothetical protein n=1 Tax=Chryseobacterium sp. c4a TaxID=1573582 RepID=UPI0013578031|nr:hypothetical protein [Chryseobacterium sp. c4a]